MTDTLVNDVISDVKAHIGENAWEKLQVETQIGIITSEMCYLSFKKDGRFDFSSAIVPAMKGLELELRRVFYEPYLDYLASNYTPDQYVGINWNKKYPGDQRAAEQRNKILSFDGTKLHYQPLSNEFTIGNFRYTIGATSLYHIHVDETFIQFAQNDFYKDYNVQKQEIINWIKSLIPEIEGLRKIRNDSSHAGKIQNALDAQTVLQKLIEVEKILALIVAPPFALV